MVIIYHLNAILAVAGLQVLHLLEQNVGGGKGILIDVTPSSSPSKAQFPQEAPVHNGSESSLSDLSSVGSLSLDLARQSVICGMALLLRDHLKYVYAITDVRMEKYVVGKRSTYGDRSVLRRADAPLALGLDDYVRMPFAVNDMVDEEDCCSQRDTVSYPLFWKIIVSNCNPFIISSSP
jgi:cohesin loading factor subunit SCC2